MSSWEEALGRHCPGLCPLENGALSCLFRDRAICTLLQKRNRKKKKKASVPKANHTHTSINSQLRKWVPPPPYPSSLEFLPQAAVSAQGS